MIVEILLLIIVANGVPAFISHLFHHHTSLPVDFGLTLPDKNPCFGANKTWRGLFSSMIVTALLAKLLGFDYLTGFLVSSLAMSGDLFSSFIKRRIGQKPGSSFLVLDQVPEAFLPAWLLMKEFNLTFSDVLAVVVAFFIIEQVLSLLFYKLGVRKNP